LISYVNDLDYFDESEETF